MTQTHTKEHKQSREAAQTMLSVKAHASHAEDGRLSFLPEIFSGKNIPS
jgi:hypothetical protein